jgi:hypothetical protein
MADRKPIYLPHARFRTKIGSGQRLLAGIDGRSAIARRYREIAGAIAQDLGGSDQLTEVQRQLIRTGAGLVVMREAMDVRLINGETSINASRYCRVSNSLRRVLATIGLTRTPKDITPLRDRLALEAEPAE